MFIFKYLQTMSFAILKTTMWAKNKYQPGFTIVELLIVIVIIGILAAITVVAYNGVQERAESTKIISRANSYVKGFKIWEADIGRTSASSCIAPQSYATCPLAVNWFNDVPNDAAFNANLQKYSGTGDPSLFKYGSDNPKGLMWFHGNYYNDNRAVLRYTVGPSSDCGLSNILSQPYDEMVLSGAKYTSRTATYTECMVEVYKW